MIYHILGICKLLYFNHGGFYDEKNKAQAVNRSSAGSNYFERCGRDLGQLHVV